MRPVSDPVSFFLHGIIETVKNAFLLLKVLWISFLGLIAIPLGFIGLGIIPAVIALVLSIRLYGAEGTRKYSFLGLFFGGFGCLHCLIILCLSVYTVLVNGNYDVLHLRWSGVKVADFGIQNKEGSYIKSNTFTEKRLILVFWASWCGPCVHEIPLLNKLNRESNVAVVGFSGEDLAVIRKASTDYGIEYEVGNLSNRSRVFSEVKLLPTIFFLDSQRVIQDVLVGSQDYETLTELALKEDYRGIVRDSPKQVFDGVQVLLDFWIRLLHKTGNVFL